MAGIMHFASFLIYMESAEHELYRSLGLSLHEEVDGELISFLRVAVACDYPSPAAAKRFWISPSRSLASAPRASATSFASPAK